MIAKEKVLVVDIDGTLCPIKEAGESYADLPAEPAMREALREWAGRGWRIILTSSRGMRTHDGNVGEIHKHVLPTLHDWLCAQDIPFDEIHLGKPWPGHDGFYVDDRAVRPREFIESDLEALERLCVRDRVAVRGR